MNIFVSCGEPSGDVYAGDLIRNLRARTGAHIWGMLGQNGISAGGEAVWGYEALHLMGIIEVIPAIPRLFKLRNDIVKKIISSAPECVVVIDSPDFHLPLIKKLRKEGYKGKIVYLVTPTVWAWRSGRAEILKNFCDLCLPLFSFENEWLLNYGINSAWKVHPLVKRLTEFSKELPPSAPPPPPSKREAFGNAKPPSQRGDARRAGGSKSSPRPIIAFMPGSRSYDIRWHIDALLESAELAQRTLGINPVFSVAPGLSGNLRVQLIEKIKKFGFEICEADGRALLSVCEAAVGVSGTISVEAMLLKRFMVVVYNGNFVSWLVWKALIRTPHISIANLLTPEKIFPELLSREMRPENIVRELKNYLENNVRKSETDALLSRAISAMGTGDAGEFWSEQILNFES